MKLVTYRTMSDAINQLRKRGFASSFKLLDGALICLETKEKYLPGDLEITEYHRFEGDSNPADMSILFALKCNDGNKGTVVSSYGTYATDGLLSFMDKVKVADKTKVAGSIRKNSFY